ncbi:MAG: hypothetical protein ACRYF4_03885 [Janthinobacterium lividum]
MSISAALAAQTRPGRAGAPSLHTAADVRDTATPPTTLQSALQNLFERSDIAFTGQVLSVDREAGAVVIRWQVLDGIRGVDAGATYAQHEWAGLWTGNSARYVTGQRALLLLHAPSVAGYASPVGGSVGVIPLRGDAASSVLDLRLLAQDVVVTDAARLRPVEALRTAGGSLAASDALQARAAQLQTNRSMAQRHAMPWKGAPETDGAGEGAATDVAVNAAGNSAVDGTVVLGLLHSWQRDRLAGR